MVVPRTPKSKIQNLPLNAAQGPKSKYDFLYEVADGVATITFNRPEVLNALTLAVYAQLRDLMEALRYDAAVKVVVLIGAGDNFCSGGDVQEIIGALLDRDMKDHLDFTRMTGALVQ